MLPGIMFLVFLNDLAFKPTFGRKNGTVVNPHILRNSLLLFSDFDLFILNFLLGEIKTFHQDFSIEKLVKRDINISN
jgi:hypothetical protein